ncbi:GFA family protein [Sphingomonas sp. PR090111-T3T-6A]|uniref:GFA family protein n=1 Tax=Sphingomonas sp. PR090111-T3T-6A TaxID=685778 RepID=UPI0009FEAE34|nr:GFA family protein [Sphingomonas sp. PR090111-T3T-6A]
MHHGSCLCRAVTFTVSGDLSPPEACHCSQCRKHSGHYFASTDVLKPTLHVSGREHVSWFQSSDDIRRGFCSQCGSSLFWEPIHRDWVSVAMGAFDDPTATKLRMHIFVGDKGDYYEIADGLPQKQRR